MWNKHINELHKWNEDLGAKISQVHSLLKLTFYTGCLFSYIRPFYVEIWSVVNWLQTPERFSLFSHKYWLAFFAPRFTIIISICPQKYYNYSFSKSTYTFQNGANLPWKYLLGASKVQNKVKAVTAKQVIIYIVEVIFRSQNSIISGNFYRNVL